MVNFLQCGKRTPNQKMKTAELLVACQWHQNFNKIARDQVTHYMEIQGPLPDNQYVFVQKDPQ